MSRTSTGGASGGSDAPGGGSGGSGRDAKRGSGAVCHGGVIGGPMGRGDAGLQDGGGAGLAAERGIEADAAAPGGASRAARNAFASANRPAGSLASRRITAAATPSGTVGQRWRRGTGVSESCFTSSVAVLPPENGSEPQSIWYATTPSE